MRELKSCVVFLESLETICVINIGVRLVCFICSEVTVEEISGFPFCY
jgi:hypothetical protein